MAFNTFPLDSSYLGIVGALRMFLDANLSQRATVFDANGRPQPGNVVTTSSSGRIPTFQAAASVLYCANGLGEVVAVYPHPGKNAPTVTGAKGGNAALTSLVQALAAEGLIVDATT